MTLSVTSAVILVLQSFLFALLLPALLIGWIPLRVFERHAAWPASWEPRHLAALVFGTIGLLAYLHCAWLFHHKGRGTVAPFAPPRKLVQRGLYRRVRNPIYLALGLMLAAETLFLASWHIGVYLLCLGCLAQIVVRLQEEPELSFRYGAMYEDYRRAVPRWLPRIAAAADPEPSSANPER